jgi:ribosomal subunit interface protein
MSPIQITVRDVPNSQALEDTIRKKALKLNQFYNRIQRISIVVEMPQKHKHQGKLFCVHIDMSVPGKELVVNRKLDQDVYIAVRDAFKAILHQLETYTKKRRGDIKHHEDEHVGYVSKLFNGEGYGFIQGVDSNEYYFSLTNMSHPEFEALEVGDIVNFLPMTASDGLQAHKVRKHKNNFMME